MPIGDDPRKQPVRRHHRPRDTGGATPHLAHRVDQMRGIAQTLGLGHGDVVGGRLGRAGKDGDACSQKRCQRAVGQCLGRQSQQDRNIARGLTDQGDILKSEGADRGGGVDAGPVRRQERPLQMQPEDAGNTRRDGRTDSSDGLKLIAPRRGNKGGQDVRGAALCGGFDHDAQGLGGPWLNCRSTKPGATISAWVTRRSPAISTIGSMSGGAPSPGNRRRASIVAVSAMGRIHGGDNRGVKQVSCHWIKQHRRIPMQPKR